MIIINIFKLNEDNSNIQEIINSIDMIIENISDDIVTNEIVMRHRFLSG